MDTRTRTVKWRQLLGLWLGSEHGLRVTPRPYLMKLSEQMADGYDPSHLSGIPGVLLHTSSERDYLPGQRLDRAKADAALGEKELFFSIQRRQDRTDIGDSLVVTSLDCMAVILIKLEKLRRLEELEAAA